MTVTPAREKVIDFSNELFSGPTSLVFKKGSGLDATPESLKGKTVGYEQGTIQEAYAKAVLDKAGVKTQAYANQDQVYADLISGRLDASIQDMLQAELGFLKSPQGADYEVVYPDFVAGLAAQSDILLTISNDTWFGTSIGPLQHLQMAQMRALEAGRWMIRATNNGVTALIDPYGQITTQIPQFERGIMYGEVVPMHELTPYLQWRSWPLAILCCLLIGWALVTSRIAKTV